MPTKKPVDKKFLGIVLILVSWGFFIFLSASYGLLTKNSASFEKVVFVQFVVGIIIGSIVAIILSRFHYSHYKKISFFLFVGASVLCLLVFIPKVGLHSGGATRWIDLGFTTFQPSELLKIAYVLYLSAILSRIRGSQMSSFKDGALPFLIITGVVAGILILQKDMGTLIVTSLAGFAIIFAAGVKFRHIFVLLLVAIIAFGVLVQFRPYLKDRILTYLNPNKDLQDSGYQIDQSLIAIGSGGLLGRGFGKSIQKFTHLPEPIGDSVFAVASEEFGFVGSSVLILLFIALYGRGIVIASRTPDQFGRLIVVGIVSVFVVQSFMNIGAMTGILPLTGIPLVFVSHGGTALFIALAGTGIILNISRYKKIA